MAVRTTFSLFREHLLILLHSEPHGESSFFGPVVQTAKALAAKARVVRKVKSCMVAGGGGAWGFEGDCVLGGFVLDKCVGMCVVIFVFELGVMGKRERRGQMGGFYR